MAGAASPPGTCNCQPSSFLENDLESLLYSFLERRQRGQGDAAARSRIAPPEGHLGNRGGIVVSRHVAAARQVDGDHGPAGGEAVEYRVPEEGTSASSVDELARAHSSRAPRG